MYFSFFIFTSTRFHASVLIYIKFSLVSRNKQFLCVKKTLFKYCHKKNPFKLKKIKVFGFLPSKSFRYFSSMQALVFVRELKLQTGH